MGDLQELHDGRPVVADGHPPPVEDELVHPPGAEGRPDGVGHRLARVDVADQLGLALSVVERAQEEIRAGGRRTNKWGEYPDGTSKQRNTTTTTTTITPPPSPPPPPPPPTTFKSPLNPSSPLGLTCEVSVPSRRRIIPGLIIFSSGSVAVCARARAVRRATALLRISAIQCPPLLFGRKCDMKNEGICKSLPLPSASLCPSSVIFISLCSRKQPGGRGQSERYL